MGQNNLLRMAESRRAVEDLFRPSPFIYWAEFLTTMGLDLAVF